MSEISPHARRLALIVPLAATLACAQRPSAEQCEAMVDHVVALMRASHEGRAAEIAEAAAEERRAALLDQCLTEGTAAEVECVLGAEALEGIPDCAPRR